eukprot:11974638-Alexandrium_andersonii.AAC.1
MRSTPSGESARACAGPPHRLQLTRDGSKGGRLLQRSRRRCRGVCAAGAARGGNRAANSAERALPLTVLGPDGPRRIGRAASAPPGR